MDYDIIVVGGGHAGCEAALAAARLKFKTLMLFLDEKAIALMACNPSIGGTAKGHLVREIDALGGEMALCADKSLLQIKMLNRAKGPAVYSLRGQEDKEWYHKNMLAALKTQEGLTLMQGEAAQILVEQTDAKKRVCGIKSKDGVTIGARAVVLACGVYLNARIVIGDEIETSGPSGYAPATELTKSLIELGLEIRRFKTGTPARIFRDSVDFSKTVEQRGEDIHAFSFMTDEKVVNLSPCYLTYTNEETHKIIRENIHRSPLYNGTITGVGPRYCPSVEIKVMRFADKARHQVFIEPEGLNHDEVYIQGMSSSMPRDVQEQMYRTISGLENCRFSKYAYAIEYDCINPLELYPSLASKKVEGLFLAGQINGSSGYEEAAAQGLIAGVNAARFLQDKPSYVPGRDKAYIGVLLDDLTTKGTPEPYRMMTARAENRIYLRQDNADRRLTEDGWNLGLVTEQRYQRFCQKQDKISKLQSFAKKPLSKSQTSPILESLGEPVPEKALTLAELMKRPAIEFSHLRALVPDEFSDEVLETCHIETKYQGYLIKQQAAVSEQKRLEEKELPKDIDYNGIAGLRLEAREKLSQVKPRNLGQASRISGVSPADIAVLIIYLQKHKTK
jgi:tRNA uridine 5-carboxymethylaminomethyl modification enzyme